MASTPNNLLNLHQNEETIRESSLAAISDNESMSDHLQAVHDALNHLTVLIKIKSTPATDIHTLQLFAIRLFNTGACSIKLGLSGYYQAAFQSLRDSLEMVNLIDLFRADSTIVSKWRAADDKKLRKEFSASAVRNALATFPQYADQNRSEIYSLFSGYASHMTYKGFSLVSPEKSPSIGPFNDIGLLRALLEDLGRHIPHATIALSTMFENGDISFLEAKGVYIGSLNKYHQKYNGINKKPKN
jgi:hypothetical protein